MSGPDVPCFDLTTQPWLLARDLDGQLHELSLVDVFDRAHRLAALVGDVPTQVFALTRLLLAVLHRAVRGPRDTEHWERLWELDRLPMTEIRGYLAAHRSRFDLLHPATPFMQVAGLHTAKGDVSHLSKLIADVPNGNRFFCTRLDQRLTLDFAEAARWVVHCHAFDPSGIKSGAVGDERVKGGKGYPIGTGWSGCLGGVLPEGRTLWETLLLNLIPRNFGNTACPSPEHDLPAWERPPGRSAEREASPSPTGPLDLLTWQSRRIRLATTGDRVTGVLICNGDRLTPQNRQITESHTAWRRSEAQEKKHRSAVPIYMPREHDPKRAVWQGLQAMLPHEGTRQGKDAAKFLMPAVLEWLGFLTSQRLVDRAHPIRMRTIGMTYGSNNSVTDEIIDDALNIQAVLVAQDAGDLIGVVRSCVRAAENAAQALKVLVANLTVAEGGDPEGPRTRAIETAYAVLDPLFREWVTDLGPNSDAVESQIQWHRQAWTVIAALAHEALAAASPAAWVGRRVNGRLVTSTHAEAWFWRDLRQALPQAHHEVAAPVSAAAKGTP